MSIKSVFKPAQLNFLLLPSWSALLVLVDFAMSFKGFCFVKKKMSSVSSPFHSKLISVNQSVFCKFTTYIYCNLGKQTWLVSKLPFDVVGWLLSYNPMYWWRCQNSYKIYQNCLVERCLLEISCGRSCFRFLLSRRQEEEVFEASIKEQCFSDRRTGSKRLVDKSMVGTLKM